MEIKNLDFGLHWLSPPPPPRFLESKNRPKRTSFQEFLSLSRESLIYIRFCVRTFLQIQMSDYVCYYIATFECNHLQVDNFICFSISWMNENTFIIRLCFQCTVLNLVPLSSNTNYCAYINNLRYIICMFDCFKICNLKIFVIRITFTMTR